MLPTWTEFLKFKMLKFKPATLNSTFSLMSLSYMQKKRKEIRKGESISQIQLFTTVWLAWMDICRCSGIITFFFPSFFHLFSVWLQYLSVDWSSIFVCRLVLVFPFFLHFRHFFPLRKTMGKWDEKVREPVCVRVGLHFWESVEQWPKTISIKTQTSHQCHSGRRTVRGKRERFHD